MIKLLDLLKEAKGQKKAIIMAGGAGAGKSTFSKQLQSDLKKAGWTDLNADKYVEDPDSTMYNNLGAAASRIDKVDLPNTLEKGQNFLYDTTASNVQRVQGIKDQGYDIMMVMVYTNPIVSFLRNFKRERKVPTVGVLSSWNNVYKNIETYKKMLGNNFHLISTGTSPEEDLKSVYDHRLVLLLRKAGLYDKLVRLAVLQSGLSNSPISFTSLLPYEDFKEIYNKTLSNLENMPNLADFNKLKVFQRNNWNDSDIVPSRKAKKMVAANGDTYYQNNANFTGNRAAMEAIAAGEIPRLLKMSSLSREAKSDVVIYSWEEVPQGKKKYDMIKEGDFSYIKKGLFQKVYDGTTPLSFDNKYGTPTYVYKLINAWGESRRVGESYFSANEFYAFAQKSVINNGFLEANEVEDDAITQYFSAEPKATVSTEPKIQDELIDEDAVLIEDDAEQLGEALEESIKNDAKMEIPSGEVKLKDGKYHALADINGTYLSELGYSQKKISEILQTICKLG